MKATMPMRPISSLLFIFILNAVSVPLMAATKATLVDKQLSEIRTAFVVYKSRFNQYPTGANYDITAHLRQIGLNISPISFGSDGSYLDPWGNPYYFLKNGSNIIILSLGAKIGKAYPSPVLVTVDADDDLKSRDPVNEQKK